MLKVTFLPWSSCQQQAWIGFKTETETALLEGNRNVSSDGDPSQCWGCTGLTEDVADSLNDAVFADKRAANKQVGGSKCRWGRLNTGAVTANWRLSRWSVVNLVPSQVYHTEHPPYLSAANFPWCSISCGCLCNSSYLFYSRCHCHLCKLWMNLDNSGTLHYSAD